MNKYLEQLELLKIKPNFWCSDEYFQKAGFRIISDDNLTWVEDIEGQIIFPLLVDNKGILQIVPDKGIWAGLKDFHPNDGQADFLDYEYIYDPKKFQEMKGKHWTVFRKNCRKYPNRFSSSLLYTSRYNCNASCDSQISELVSSWLESIPDSKVHDATVLLEYVFKGMNRKILVDGSGQIHGLNIWDENYMFINYRYCICQDEPFLSEYMRWLFYIDMIEKDKLVNDGGILDRPALKKFKDKLNPIEVNEVYSWNIP